MAAAPRSENQKKKDIRTPKRFRINPVELVIFSVVSLVFLNSVYHLFYDWQGFKPAKLVMLENVEGETDTRRPASGNPGFVNLEFSCEDSGEHKTGATKLRLNGPLCRAADEAGQERAPAAAGSVAADLIRTEITNSANSATATVFTDVQAAKFSTDYIPLERGTNSLNVKFVYKGGKVISQTFTVVRE